MAELPHELLFVEILPRVPMKSVGRFLCVSKLWYSSLINLTRPARKLLLQSRTGCYPGKLITQFHTLDYELKEQGVIRRCYFPFPQPTVHELSSCNGIICLWLQTPRCRKDRFVELMLWNPSTGNYKMVKSRFWHVIHNRPKAWAFWYDASFGDYKILTLSRKSKAHVFNLKSDSWRAINGVGVVARIRRWFVPQPGVFVNGKIYWVMYERREDFVYLPSLIFFDLNYGKLRKIQFHGIERRFESSILGLTIHQGCLHLFVSYHNFWEYRVEELEVWRMNENMEQGWEKITIISTKDKWKYDSRPICVTIDGEILMHLRYKCYDDKDEAVGEIVAYNADSSQIQHNFKIRDSIIGTSRKTDPICEAITYFETRVSPNCI